MTFEIERLPASYALVDAQGRPNRAFSEWWEKMASQLEAQEASQDTLLAQISEILGLTADLDAAVTAAQAAADSAAADAATAQAVADGADSIASLTNSGVAGVNVLSATDAGGDATITVAAHTRLYGNGSSLAIAGPVAITGLAYATAYYVYYDDPTRADTTPDYQTTTSETTAAQTGDRHLVGLVTTPAALAAPTGGRNVRPPGIGGIEP